MSKMDIGRLGNPEVVFKRKFRWTFTVGDSRDVEHAVTYANSSRNGHICKVSARPSISFSEQQVYHVIETVYLPGKAEWSPIEITTYDIAGDSYLYKWLISFYDPWNGTVRPIAQPITNSSKPKKEGNLCLLDGHGKIIERWLLEGCWPKSINWGELDYNSNEIAEIQFSLRYDRAILQDINGSPITNALR